MQLKYPLMCLSVLLASLAFTCGDNLDDIDFENGIPHKTGDAVSEEAFHQAADGFGWKRVSSVILSSDKELNDKDFYSVYPDADSYEFISMETPSHCSCTAAWKADYVSG